LNLQSTVRDPAGCHSSCASRRSACLLAACHIGHPEVACRIHRPRTVDKPLPLRVEPHLLIPVCATSCRRSHRRIRHAHQLRGPGVERFDRQAADVPHPLQHHYKLSIYGEFVRVVILPVHHGLNVLVRACQENVLTSLGTLLPNHANDSELGGFEDVLFLKTFRADWPARRAKPLSAPTVSKGTPQ